MGTVDLTSASWEPGGWEHYQAAQTADRTREGVASGERGAVTVAYGAPAARAGLEALKQGGTAADAALTTALAQVALTAGSAVSYFGILSLVHRDAATGEIHTMNAEWDTLSRETDPLTIPGGTVLDGTVQGARGGEPSGRAAMVGGFLKGVEAAHRRFGVLPFASLFGPSIEIAERGTPVCAGLGLAYRLRADDLARLPETRQTLLKPDGSPFVRGEILRQPRLAATLRRIAEEGTDLLYRGELGERIVAAVRADGGHMTIDDLARYDVRWAPPLTADLGAGLSIATAPWPNAGGVAMIEALHLAAESGLLESPHWTRSGASLRTALDVTRLSVLSHLPADAAAALFPGLDLSPDARVTREHARRLWERVKDGSPLPWSPDAPRHSDDVVAIDADGNIAAITHSINCVLWGRPAIVVDGITVGDPGAHQQRQIAAAGPGERLPAPTETGIVLRDDEPVLGFASMGSGLHEKTFQSLVNHLWFGMDVADAARTPDFFLPTVDPSTGAAVAAFPAGEFDHTVLDDSGLPWREVGSDESRFGGEGYWVAVSRDPATGRLDAVSHHRNNSAAVAY